MSRSMAHTREHKQNIDPSVTELDMRSLTLRRLRTSDASALASSVCGRCMFISSPSKSALYGEQTHSLNRKVLQGMICPSTE